MVKEWAQKQDVLDAFGLPDRRLRELVAEGYVRSLKLSGGRSALRLFNVADVSNVLEALAAGLEPTLPPEPRFRPSRKARRREPAEAGNERA